jgi:hypothetical protein
MEKQEIQIPQDIAKLLKNKKVKILRKLFELAKNNNVIINVILGCMQSGKTTLALHLAALFEKIGYESYYIWTDFEEAITYLHSFDKPANIIFDDISFYFTSFQKSTPFMKYIARIYHYAKNKVIVNFVIHYSKGILPFMRIAHDIFLTSLLTPEEIKGLKNYFFLNDLWQFYRYYSLFYHEHPVLAKVMNYIRIIKRYEPKKPSKIIDLVELKKIKKPNPEIENIFYEKNIVY